MGKSATIEKVFTNLGIYSKSNRDLFKDKILRFFNERIQTDDCLLTLNPSDIERYVQEFLDSLEGIQCLTQCVEDNDWHLSLDPVNTRVEVQRLIKLWIKNKKIHHKYHSSLGARGNESNSATADFGTQASTSTSPTTHSFSVARVPLATIDLVSEEEDLYSQPLNTSHSDNATDERVTTLPTLDEGEQPADTTIAPSQSKLAHTDLQRLREYTLESEDTPAPVVLDRPPVSMAERQDGLLSPHDTRSRSVRTRDEDINDYIPAAGRPAAKRLHHDNGDGNRPQPEEARADLLIVTPAGPMNEPRASENRNVLSELLAADTDNQLALMESAHPTQQVPDALFVNISSQDARFTYDELAKIPPMIAAYLRTCEQHFLRKSKSRLLPAEERKTQLDRARLLRELCGDIVSQMIAMSRGKLKREGIEYEDGGSIASSHVLLW